MLQTWVVFKLLTHVVDHVVEARNPNTSRSLSHNKQDAEFRDLNHSDGPATLTCLDLVFSLRGENDQM